MQQNLPHLVWGLWLGKKKKVKQLRNAWPLIRILIRTVTAGTSILMKKQSISILVLMEGQRLLENQLDNKYLDNLLYSQFAVRNSKKRFQIQTKKLVWAIGDLDTILILNKLIYSLRINLVSIGASKDSLLPKPVSWFGLFCCFLQQTGSRLSNRRRLLNKSSL